MTARCIAKLAAPKYHIDPLTFDYPAAFKAISDAMLCAYQLFYFKGLTSPGHPGSPWSIDIRRTHGARMSGFEARHVDKSLLKEGFEAWGRTPMELLEKVETLESAKREGKVKRKNAQDCCPLAETKYCVCVYSYTCPVHGGRCIGNHD